MREFKFRVWDKATNSFAEDWKIYFNGSVSIQGTWATDDAVVMQYTGLKDKNGKEIYEGDILKHPRWRSEYKCKKCGHNPKESQTFLVFWQNKWHHDYGYTTVGRWALEVIGGFDEYELNEAEKYEVIGNKFQNPELLDQ